MEGDTATAETYCLAHHIHERDGVVVDRTLAIRYRDRLVRAGDRWRFAERILVVDWESEQPLRAGIDGLLASKQAFSVVAAAKRLGAGQMERPMPARVPAGVGGKRYPARPPPATFLSERTRREVPCPTPLVAPSSSPP